MLLTRSEPTRWHSSHLISDDAQPAVASCETFAAHSGCHVTRRRVVMAMNQVQFQAGLSMAPFIQQYGTEAKYYRALYRAR